MRAIDPDIKAYVDFQVQQQASRLQANGTSLANLLLTLRNFGTVTNQATATLTAPSNAILAGISLVSKVSGKFLVCVSGTATAGAVEAAGVSTFLSTNYGNTSGATITPTNGTAAGTNGFVSTGTTAITLSASAGSITSANQSTSQSLNGLAASALEAGFGMTMYSVGGFAIGAPAFFGLNVTISTTTVQVTGLSMFAVEMP